MPVWIYSNRIKLGELTSLPTTVDRGSLYFVNGEFHVDLSPSGATTPTLRKLSFPPFGTADILDGAITSAKIADGAVTDAKVAPGISVGKIAFNANVNFGGYTLSNVNIQALSVQVGDLIFSNNWRFTECEEELCVVSPSGKKFKLALIPID